MANISVSLNLQAYQGFKYLSEKDAAGKKTYYAAIPVTQLFNPSGTTKVYATAVMIPTPGSEYSDFMLKPMLSAKELQSMDPDQFKALPVLGTGKYLQKQVSKDLMQEASKSASVDEEDMSAIFGMPAPQGQPQMPQGAQMAPPQAAAPAPPAPVIDPRTLPDTFTSLYYITDNGTIIAQAKTWTDAYSLFAAQVSPTALLHKYQDNVCVGSWTKVQLQQLGL